MRPSGPRSRLLATVPTVSLALGLTGCPSSPTQRPWPDVTQRDADATAPIRDVQPLDVTPFIDESEDCSPIAQGSYCPPVADVPTMPVDARLQVVSDAGPSLPAPTLRSPVSPLGVAQFRPELRWTLPPGAEGAVVDLCRDRACERPIQRFEVSGSSGRPPDPIPPGIVFWRAYARDARGASTNVSATWEFWVRRRDTSSGAPWGVHRDFNGDGFEDVAIPSSREEWFEDTPEGRFRGGVGVLYVYHGGPCGIDGRPPAVLRSRRWDGVNMVLDYAGDFDGDGFADLLLWNGVDRRDGHTILDVLFGAADGLSNARDLEIVLPAEYREGRTVAAGDLDGDGFTDLAFGNETITVVYGNAERSAAQIVLSREVQDRRADAGAFGYSHHFGVDFAQLGLEGRGALLVDRGITPMSDRVRLGAYVVNDRSSLTGVWEVERATTGYAAPVLLRAAGDVDGDGTADVYAFGTEGGIAYAGGAVSAPNAGWNVARPAEVLPAFRDSGNCGIWGFCGWDPAGDFDGDGATEVVMGSACTPRVFDDQGNPACGNGRAYVYRVRGTEVGAWIYPAVTLVGHGVGSKFGLSESAADLNGDGYDDLVVAAPGVMATTMRRPDPRVSVFWGAAGGLQPARVSTIVGCPGRRRPDFGGWLLAPN